jgi:hypothetical protein
MGMERMTIREDDGTQYTGFAGGNTRNLVSRDARTAGGAAPLALTKVKAARPILRCRSSRVQSAFRLIVA